MKAYLKEVGVIRSKVANVIKILLHTDKAMQQNAALCNPIGIAARERGVCSCPRAHA